MMFNVEDLLALPQLKSGNLPKNFSYVDIKKASEQVADIMDYQLTSKGISFDIVFCGFPVSPLTNEEDYTIIFDK